jgi:hypothetical protein
MLSRVPSAPFVVPPLLLIAILVVSGVAKIRDRRDTWSVFDKLRLPRFLSTIKAPVLLPYGELVLAAMLLLLPDGWYVAAATLALLLFAAYLVVVVRALGFGYPLLCGCFGELGLGWITRQTAVRNAILLAVALVTWVDSWRGDGVYQRLHGLGDDWWWLAGVVLAMVTTAVLVREGDLPPYVAPDVDDEAYVALPIPYTVLDGPDGPGATWRLSDTAARLLVFWDPTDAETAVVADRVPTWQRLLAPVRVHLVTQSEWEQAVAVRPDLAEVLLGDPEGETRLRLGVTAMPGAVLLGTDRQLAGGPVDGPAAIEELVEAAAAELAAAVGATAEETPA